MTLEMHRVVDPFVTPAGVAPDMLFREALDKAGSMTSGPTPTGEFASQCPAHSDDRASLTWRQSSSGEILFNCHAGCEGDAVVRSLKLKWWQLKLVSLYFDYHDAYGTYLFTVKRHQDTEGGKTFTQMRRGTGPGGTDEDGNGLEPGAEVLWLEPALDEWAGDVRATGSDGVLWLVEGEKDVMAVWGSGSLGAHEFCTTTPAGAGGWKPAHTERLKGLADGGVIKQVVVVCDPDNAGAQRGAQIREALEYELPDVAVRIVTVAPGKDIAELADKMNKAWVTELHEVTEEENRTLLEEGTSATGYVARLPLGPGAGLGRVGLGMRVVNEPKLVLSCDVWPVAIFADGEGWLVEVQGARGEKRECVLWRADLRGKQSFDKWLVTEARGSLVPRCGVSSGDFAAGLAVYLDWLADARGVGGVRLTRHSGWLDGLTGLPVKNARPGQDVVWIDGKPGQTVYRPAEGGPFWTPKEPESGTEGLRYVGEDESPAWGLQGTETDAAWAWARALTFGDRAAVASIAGWGAAMLLAPWVGKWSPTKPGLAVIAASGSGKTSGAGRLLMGLCGGSGNMTASVAALRRKLSQGGVSSIRWIDDSSHIDDFNLKEILRVATSQGDHVLSDTDRGAGATQSVSLLGCVAISAEGVSWLDETAMLDRFLLVHPENPQKRKSVFKKRAGSLQWPDVQDLIAEWGDSPTELAGWTLRGLYRAAGLEGLGGKVGLGGALAEWVKEVGPPKGRSDVGPFLAAVGARAIRAWLKEAFEGASEADEWPVGDDDVIGSWAREWDWLVEKADELLVEARANSERFGTLVTKVLPRAIHAQNKGPEGPGSTLGYIEIRGGSVEDFKNEVRAKTSMTGKVNLPLPMLVIDEDKRVWVCAKLVAHWWSIVERGAEARVGSERALQDQLNQIADDPDWAAYEKPRAGTEAYKMTGVQITKRGGFKYKYRRLPMSASSLLLEGE